MNRRTWKDLITKRSTIWTLSLCLVGVIVLGGMAAVNNSRRDNETQPETELGQIAYLEEEQEEDSTRETSSAPDAADDDTNADLPADSANAEADMTAGSADAEADMTAGSEDSDTDTSDSSSTDESGTGESVTDTASGTDESSDSVLSGSEGDSDSASTDSEEASSASIISEQTLIDAGVSFTDEQSLLWPSAGTIAIDYSMDKSVYFQTLNQYKYNPALIISSDTGNQVLAAAKGIVESVSVDEETGTTLVLNIGNGYRLTYGQLMEPAVSEGDVVETGDLLAYISEPTKYYSMEGSNLYFAMTKDGEPVDPVLYLE